MDKGVESPLGFDPKELDPLLKAANPPDALNGESTDGVLGLELTPNVDDEPKAGVGLPLPNDDCPKDGACGLLSCGVASGEAVGVLFNPPPVPKAETNAEGFEGVVDANAGVPFGVVPNVPNVPKPVAPRKGLEDGVAVTSAFCGVS